LSASVFFSPFNTLLQGEIVGSFRVTSLFPLLLWQDEVGGSVPHDSISFSQLRFPEAREYPPAVSSRRFAKLFPIIIRYFVKSHPAERSVKGKFYVFPLRLILHPHETIIFPPDSFPSLSPTELPETPTYVEGSRRAFASYLAPTSRARFCRCIWPTSGGTRLTPFPLYNLRPADSRTRVSQLISAMIRLRSASESLVRQCFLTAVSHSLHIF